MYYACLWFASLVPWLHCKETYALCYVIYGSERVWEYHECTSYVNATMNAEGLVVRELHHLYKLNEVQSSMLILGLYSFYGTHRVWSGKRCRSDETSPSADMTTLARSAR